jgi:hypothetical protein
LGISNGKSRCEKVAAKTASFCTKPGSYTSYHDIYIALDDPDQGSVTIIAAN